MKKSKFLTVLSLAALFVFAACSGSSGGDEPEPEINSGIPEGFVKVAGSTVTGGNKFYYEGPFHQFPRSNDFFGVFVPGRSVTIADFYMCDHEVTQAEYQEVMGYNPGRHNYVAPGETQVNLPVEHVTWNEAIFYCNKKSIADGLQPCYTIRGKTNPMEWGDCPWQAHWCDVVNCDFTKNGYRLPTEAEWEYAARGGKAGCEAANPDDWAGTDDWIGSDYMDDPYDGAGLGTYAWYSRSSTVFVSESGFFIEITHEVKKKTKNSLNLFDMSGNVEEWCWDFYDKRNGYYPITSTTPATGFESGYRRVIRGGFCGSEVECCSVAWRHGENPDNPYDYVGFRVVRSKL